MKLMKARFVCICELKASYGSAQLTQGGFPTLLSLQFCEAVIST